jgi:23S rRNA pseudouridine2605 synthase
MRPKHTLIKNKESGPRKSETQRSGISRGSKKPVLVKRKSSVPAKTYGKPKRSAIDKRTHLNPTDHSVRLNKYIANAGVCSRREADKLIETGAIKVNGKIVTELGTKINPGDVVHYDNHILTGETLRYVLLNKPKGFISTVEDPQERKTVMMLVQNACKERIYPVGRLDRNTTGLLLLTNDGDLAKKLTHPKHNVRKVYHVELDKPLTKNDLLAIAAGIDLDDGFIAMDAIEYTGTGEDKKKIGVEIHSGRNRIVRRIFEHMGYEIEKLDRVVFAGLTKKDLPRGKFRHLSATEINILRRIK